MKIGIIKQHKVIVLFAILAFAVIAIETNGYLIRRHTVTSRIANTIPDEILNHKFPPNFRYVDTVRGIPNPIFTNSQSWAEHEDITTEKPANTYRIFYVGDSTTHGTVPDEQRMPDIVEKELNIIYQPRGKHIEVINTGTSSYSTIIYYLLIKTEILKYKPDLVIINEDMGDVRDDSAYKLSAEFDAQGLPIAAHPSDPKLQGVYHLTPQGLVKIPLRQRINAYMVANSVIIKWSEGIALNILQRIAPKIYQNKIVDPLALNDPGDWLKLNWDSTVQNNVDFSMKTLVDIIQLLRSNGVKVMITGVPHYPQYTGQWSAKPHQVLAETTQKFGVPYLNSYEALKSQISNTPVTQYYWQVDPTHFNSAGNAIWAKAQLDFLLNPTNHLLPPR